ncbi:tRNA(Ile)-lysidine synthase [Synergistales bacterium]|nr:tRNA(Ile)-lysidine synthase [Synergistales bacterium]
MLTLLRRIYPGKLKAAHLEHGIRGGASLVDAEFVERYCANIDVPCFVRRRDVVNNRAAGESVEMAGRRERYNFFFELSESEGIPFVATAHNSGDVIETMLLNLFRGSGVKGLSGIAEVAGRVVRPVIDRTGEELRAFLSSEGIPWREDETNSENHYQRNKIRNQLLPWVRENLNDSPEAVLLGFAKECAELSRSMDTDARALLGWLSRTAPPALAAWDMRLARSLTDERLARVLRAQGSLLSLPAIDRRRTGSLIGLIRNSGRWRFQWSGNIEVCGSPLLIGWLNRPRLKR